MKRAKKVFRGAIVEGIGALIFLLIVAVSLPNLLDNSGLNSPNQRPETANERQMMSPQHPAQLPEFRQSGQSMIHSRQALYEVPVAAERADVINTGELSDTFSYVDQPLYEVDTRRGPIRQRFQW